ncbi:hypothetical protein K2Z84_13865 [Candidatus Binatia bacterium]|nr:hypothetical protein [Candidatus Binatia bacterium]
MLANTVFDGPAMAKSAVLHQEAFVFVNHLRTRTSMQGRPPRLATIAASRHAPPSSPDARPDAVARRSVGARPPLVRRGSSGHAVDRDAQNFRIAST